MSKRIGNLEFRWTRSYGASEATYPEIVCWFPCSDNQAETCYTLMHWVRGSEGWDIRFVGDRPFDQDRFDREILWQLMQYGQSLADAEFRIYRYEIENKVWST